MYSRQHRISRKPSDSHDVPASNQFAPRPFVIQPQTEEVKPPQNQTADLQAKEEKSKEIASGFPDAAVFTRHVAPPKTPRVQMKLNIGKVGDKYEQEADKTAANVVQQINAPKSQSVQREVLPEDDKDSLKAKPMVQRLTSEGGTSATPDIEESIQGAKGSGQPLAENVRQPMEKAFGADFSGVKVHTDGKSDQLNQSIQAKAFTTGQDVFFRQGEYNPGSRGGQELLAHELTHVVQQNGGAVELGGSRLLAKHEQPSIHLRQQITNSLSHVIQRELAVQIRPGASDTVDSVEILGRPEGFWSDTMGDHTTAFIVHIESIRSRLKGQTIGQAIISMKTMVEETKKLPGIELVTNLEGSEKEKYEAALTRLDEVAQNLTDATHLQSYINAYLQFRELIPGSTIKTKLKTGYFGKGKGESGHAAKLVSYEKSKDSTEGLVEAIEGLFDSTGVGMMAVETGSKQIKAMSPGMDINLNPVARAQQIWNQHLASIKLSFPNCYAAVEGELKAIKVPEMILAQVERDIEQDNQQIKSQLDMAVKAKSEIALLTEAKKKPKYLEEDYLGDAMYRVYTDNLKQCINEAEEWIERGEIQYDLLKKIDPNTKVTFDAVFWRNSLTDAKNTSGDESTRTRQTRRKQAPISIGQSEEKDSSEKRGKKRGRDTEADNPKGPSNTAGKKQKLGTQELDVKQPMAIQIQLDNEGKVKEMIAGGRPPSPFPDTMGAHTTSWIVHLDHVRAYIIGRQVPAAIEQVTIQLIPDAYQMYNEIGAGAGSKLTPRHNNMLVNAKETLEKSKAAAKAESNNPLFLQMYIQHLLTYINSIPNATLHKIDTTGHGEGTWRNILNNYEASVKNDGKNIMTDPDELRKAICCLFDSPTTGPRWNNHLRIISRTYPNAFQQSGYTLKTAKTDEVRSP